jgi:predicted tellurium resistance membrane protein TerC
LSPSTFRRSSVKIANFATFAFQNMVNMVGMAKNFAILFIRTIFAMSKMANNLHHFRDGEN